MLFSAYFIFHFLVQACTKILRDLFVFYACFFNAPSKKIDNFISQIQFFQKKNFNHLEGRKLPGWVFSTSSEMKTIFFSHYDTCWSFFEAFRKFCWMIKTQRVTSPSHKSNIFVPKIDGKYREDLSIWRKAYSICCVILIHAPRMLPKFVLKGDWNSWRKYAS